MTTAHAPAMRAVAPSYQLLKRELARAVRGAGLLPDASAAASIEDTYQALIGFFPTGTPVTAVYMHEGTPVEITGTVIGSSRSSNEEPSFAVAVIDGVVRDLPGSLLARTDA
ncbi:hypothetical protein [Cellulosimicrobium sp. Marseille-Q4280]|uniref:hypothetical protein n=1 Tax=Cellulosimicrobium sp. Marseille-Q4280 TaxID=2937992 RepID=UPI00203BE5B0|nr:hypothetical protein [Cellulosimicrobium sp. Marseille-Q4280]